MRRRWYNRWGRGRREGRAPRTPASQQRRQHNLLVLVCTLLALALWAILAVQVPTNTGLQPGSPSPIEVRAPRTVTFVSELLTEQDRFRAESDPDAVVYTRDSNVLIQQHAQLADLLQTITQIRDDPSLSTSARRDKLTALPLPNSTLVISPSLAMRLARLTLEEWAVVQRESLSLCFT